MLSDPSDALPKAVYRRGEAAEAWFELKPSPLVPGLRVSDELEEVPIRVTNIDALSKCEAAIAAALSLTLRFDSGPNSTQRHEERLSRAPPHPNRSHHKEALPPARVAVNAPRCHRAGGWKLTFWSPK